MRWILSTIVVLCGLASSVAADSHRVAALLRLDDIVTIMREEGLIFGRDLGQDMLRPGQEPEWKSLVSQIYDMPKMTEVLMDEFTLHLPEEHCSHVEAFFTTPLGQKIVAGEINARRAFLDPETENAAYEVLRNPSPETMIRIEAIADFMLRNQLIEYNVAGGLTANYKFFQGLVQGGYIILSEEEILKEAWAIEDELRRDTRDWLLAYLMLAYKDLTLEEIEAYARFSTSHAGKALNAAVFVGFDRMYADLSLALGLGVASLARGHKL